MMAFLEELVVCIAISLGVRAVTTVAEALFVPGRTAKPERPQTCGECGTAISAEAPLHQHESASRALPPVAFGGTVSQSRHGEAAP
jgi:hypothetical protein